MIHTFVVKGNRVYCGNCGAEISTDIYRTYYVCRYCALKLTEKAPDVTKVATLYDSHSVDYYYDLAAEHYAQEFEQRYDEPFDEADYPKDVFQSIFEIAWERHKNDINDTELWNDLLDTIELQVKDRDFESNYQTTEGTHR